MTATRAEVERLLDLLAATPPLERAEAAAEVVRVADASEDEEMRFRARLELVSSFFYAAGKHRMFAPFAFVVQRYDADADWLDEDDRYQVLWLHKWMVGDLLDHPEVPLDQLQSVLDGMRRRYEAAGEGLAPVLSSAYVLRKHVHGAAAAEAEFLAWRRAPRTRLSDCEGCEPDQRISHLAAVGRHQEAVDELGPVVRGEVGCSEQPQRAISSALASLVEVGDVETAAALHRTAYRASRRNPGETGAVARHLLVLARTGSVARGMDLLAEQLGALERPSSPLTGMYLAAAAARLLHTVVDAGDGEQLVRGRGREPERAVDLLARVESQALTTAQRFDERNGTTTVSDRVRAMITAPDLPALPLGAVGAPAPHADASIELTRVPSDPAFQVLADLDALDVTGLAALAEQAGSRAHTPTHELLRTHWTARRGSVLPQLDRTDPALVRAAADIEAFCVAASDAPEPDLTRSAAELYLEVGDRAGAALVELMDDLHAERPIDADAVLAVVDPSGTAGQRARARARLAVVATDEDAAVLRSDALELLDAIEEPGPADRGLTARLRLVLGLESVLDGLLPGEEPEVRVHVQVGRAEELAAADDLTGASALLDEAAATARSAGAPELVLLAEAQRHRLFAAAGDEPRAEAHALAVAAVAVDEGMTDLAVELRLVVAHLMAGQGRELEAIELAEATLTITHPPAVVPEGRRLYRLQQRVGLLDLASRLSSSMDESDRALALARDAVELATRSDGPSALATPALIRLAGLLEDDDAVEATRLYAQALDSAQVHGDEAAALVVRRARVWSRYDADGLDAALADVQDALDANAAAQARILADPSSAAGLAEWSFDWEEATLLTMMARVLAQAEEYQRALDALDGLPERWAALPDDLRALDVESLRGTVLLRVGRDAEGLALLDDVATRARALGATGLSTNAAGVAATWLDDAGRPDEAEALWERHVTGSDGD